MRHFTVTGTETAARMAATHSAISAGSRMRQAPKRPDCTRSDGQPTYQLSVVADDVDMQISQVIRGDDHISNTPKQLLLYDALGETPPSFAHDVL